MSEQSARHWEIPKLKLRRLKIHKWRNVLPGTDLHFSDGLHALLGKNGTGKTTLLKLISMCVKCDFRSLRSEAFDFEYELSCENVALVVRNRHAPDGTKKAPARPRDHSGRHELDVQVAAPCLGALRARSSHEQTEFHIGDSVPRTTAGDGGSAFDPDYLLSLIWRAAEPVLVTKKSGALEEVNALAHGLAAARSASRFDEMLGWMDAMLGNGRKDSDLTSFQTWVVRYTSPQLTVVDSQLLPDKLWNAGKKLDSWDPSIHSLKFDASELSFLGKFAALAKVGAGEMQLPIAEDKRDESEQQLLFGPPAFFFSGPGDFVFSLDRASYGQKRLLSFLHYCACNPSILIADELTNGLHHEWIEACVEELEKRQSFVATQNPLLIDYLPVTCAKDAETAFIQCRTVEKDGKQWMHWRNTTPEEGERFWKSYATGVQFISEILRTEGLW